MSTLNSQQRLAVRHSDSPLLVLAGAGSGKTRVITHKIAYLVHQCGVAPSNIFAVTFTNKAAREMKQRVATLLDAKLAKDLNVSTFHSLGLMIIRHEFAEMGYRKGFSIFDAQDSITVLQEITHRKSEQDEITQLRARISDWKNALVNPDMALRQADDETEQKHATLYAHYQRQLKAYNALDFDDLILQPVNMLADNAEVLERWQETIQYLLIDEYQDTNHCQYQMVRSLIGSRACLTVVGDDYQSVYGWRGARPENLANMHKDFSDLKIIKLEQNYRSSGRILGCANTLIACNQSLFEKNLWSELGIGDPVSIMACTTPEHEARKVTGEILRAHYRYSSSYQNFAILYRGNYQARPFEKALREQEIPYTISGGSSFFEKAEIKDILAYLRLANNPDDDPAFLRIINTPRREIGSTTLEKLSRYAGDKQMSLYAASQDAGLVETLPMRSRLRLQGFAEWMDEIIRASEDSEPVETALRILNETNYSDWLRGSSRSEELAVRRYQNIEELLDWMRNLAARFPSRDSLDAVLKHMMLMDMLQRNEDSSTADNAVQLMTLHAAKGLEFDHVFLVGFEEELLPHHSCMEGEQLQEERRLAYVGITRARKRLTVSYCSKRTRYGENLDCVPSRFLQELPEKHIEWDTERDSGPDSEHARESGKAHLQHLHQLLG